jgi:hypothetical protein
LANTRLELQPLLSNFRFGDVALKAVGVGSVGMHCVIGLWVDQRGEEALVLQSKEAHPSVLAPYVTCLGPTIRGSG